MKVVKLVAYNCRETVAVLRVLLSRALKGELRGLALCYRDEDGAEHSLFTGIYKERPETAWAAAARISMSMELGESRLR